VKNDRLNHAGYLWAFAAPNGSPGAKAHYRRRRDEHGAWDAAARNLFNRMLGQLYHCLQHRTLFDELTAFPPNSSPDLTRWHREVSGGSSPSSAGQRAAEADTACADLRFTCSGTGARPP
jgi:hypothetical protein